MSNDMNGSKEVQRANLDRVLAKALASPKFKSLLLSNPSEILSGEHLSLDEFRLLSDLSRDEIEEQGVDVRPYRNFLKTDGHKC